MLPGFSSYIGTFASEVIRNLNEIIMTENKMGSSEILRDDLIVG